MQAEEGVGAREEQILRAEAGPVISMGSENAQAAVEGVSQD